MTVITRLHIPSAIAAATILLVTLMSGMGPTASAGTAVVFIEDFESGAIGSRWTSADNNPTSGPDYWGVSSARTHAGNYSAWCAQFGTQAGSGQNNTAAGQYDNDMQADLTINLSVSGFTSLTLSFWYWSRAEAGGGDYLEAWYVAGGTSTMIFQNRGTASWNVVSLAVPSNVEQLVIRFTSDAANNNFEGAYVDDVVMTGTENSAPSSSAAPLPQYWATDTVDVAFSAADGVNESGVAFVELWYRPGTTGNFTLYTRPANPSGQWIASPARFDVTYATGDGYYEFYTVAVDNASNREAPAAGPDASTTVDTTAPSVAITAPAADQAFTTSTVTFTWEGADATAGLARFEVWLDDGTHENTTTLERTIANIPDGPHTFHVRAVDRAGNSREASVTFSVLAASSFPWWLVLLILAAIVLLLLFFLWRRRDSEDRTPSPRPEDGMDEPEEPPLDPPSVEEGEGMDPRS